MPFYPPRPRSGADFCTSILNSMPGWVAEPKINGIRALVSPNADSDRVLWNRHMKTMDLAERNRFGPFIEKLRQITDRFNISTFDVETLGRYTGQPTCMFVFDIQDRHLYCDYDQRRAIMESMGLPVLDLGTSPPPGGGLFLVPNGDPVTMWNKCVSLRGDNSYLEGIVLKEKHSTYDWQISREKQETSSWVKFRFENSPCKPLPSSTDRNLPVSG